MKQKLLLNTIDFSFLIKKWNINSSMLAIIMLFLVSFQETKAQCSNIVTPSITVVASKDMIDIDEIITYTAIPVNGGSNPTYLWFVDGVREPSNNTTSVFSTSFNSSTNSTPRHLITCFLGSDAECVIETGAFYSFYTYINPDNLPPMAFCEVSGNGQVIENGDSSPRLEDSTNFGDLPLTDNFIIKTFTIKNTGTEDLFIRNISANPAGAFSILYAPNRTVLPGNSYFFQVSFDKSCEIGTFSSEITIDDNDDNAAPFTFKVSATIPPPYFEITAERYDEFGQKLIVDNLTTLSDPSVENGAYFGALNHCDYTQVKRQKFVFKNTSGIPINLSNLNITITGPNVAEFSLVSTNMIDGILPYGESMWFEIVFRASDYSLNSNEQKYKALVEITADLGCETEQIGSFPIAGDGIVLTKNITVQLGTDGLASIIAAQIINGSTYNCGIASTVIDINSFNCSNVGENTVTLTVTDVNGNIDSNTAIVTVEDTVKPTVLTKNITVQLGTDGLASIIAAQINNGSTDNCGIASTVIDINSFNCSNVGENIVTLTVTDVNGNIDSNTAIVTVEDTTKPVVNTKAITVQLLEDGTATITDDAVNDGSTDNCGIASYATNIKSFDCSNVGQNTVTLTVTDVNGKSASNTAIVMVEENASSNCASLGVSDFNRPKVLLYPNPTKDSFTINGLENSGATIQIISSQGQIVKTIYNHTSGDISLKNLANGVYFIKIITNGTSQTKSLLKNN